MAQKFIAMAFVLLLAHPAAAQSPDEPTESPTPARRALNVGAAIFPGLLVHGSGHLVAGDFRTGKTLLAAQGGGILLTVGGIAGLAITGASPKFNSPLISTTIAGVGLFSVSALADLYGVIAPSGGFGVPTGSPPLLELQLGYVNIDNPTFDHHHLAHARAALTVAALRAEPEVWIATDDDNWRAKLTGAWRLLGPKDGVSAVDGSFLELLLAFGHHRYSTEGFSEDLGEVALSGRLDLARVGPSLRGAFTELSLGLAYGAYTYDDIATEPTDMLIGGFAFGVYLGHAPGGWGELALYYDHRHDGYAEGLKAVGLGSGVPGHFGLKLETQVWGRWGISADVQVGSAVVTGLSAVYRLGGQR